jgi:predicted Zn-dependent peptidase
MPWLRRRAGVVLTYVATAPEREEEAREAMLRELARLASEPIPTAEIERARNYAAGSVAIGRQRGAAVVADLLDAWLYGFLDEFADPGPAYRAVSAGAVRDLARRVFVEGGRAEFVLRGSGKSR